MPRKKPVDWLKIKARYYKGEKPKEIAPDFGVTPKQISDRATREGWTRKRSQMNEKIDEKIQSLVEDDLAELCQITVEVHKEFMRNLKGQMADITNPYLFDGERTNSLFQTAMNNSVKVFLAAIKAQEDKQQAEGPQIFFIDGVKQEEL